MAKNVARIITLSLVSIILASAPNLALAAPAIHIDTDVCEIDGPDGPVKAPGKIVLTKSLDGNISMICHVRTTNTNGEVFVKSGSETEPPCSAWINSEIGLAHTNDWKLIVSASGQSTLSCHFKT